MVAAFPDAELNVLWDDAPGRFETATVESWIARTRLRRHKALALPFMNYAWRALPAQRQPDWILASSHLFAHHARFRGVDPATPKYAYVHTPARYIWTPELDARGARLAIRPVLPALRRIDRVRAAESTAIAANSMFVRDRIAATWHRDAQVIYPPVDVDRIIAGAWRETLNGVDLAELESLPETFVLGVSRFIPYKRLDLVIAAGERSGVPVVIAGRGPEEPALRQAAAEARVPVHIVHSPSDALLYHLYDRAKALVFPAVEDFGIVPVEAQAMGTPVVTGPIGGQTESLVPGVSGTVADSFSVADLSSALDRALALDPFDGAIAERFGNRRFVEQIKGFVGERN